MHRGLLGTSKLAGSVDTERAQGGVAEMEIGPETNKMLVRTAQADNKKARRLTDACSRVRNARGRGAGWESWPTIAGDQGLRPANCLCVCAAEVAV